MAYNNPPQSCAQCGTPILFGAQSCPQCGRPYAQRIRSLPPRITRLPAKRPSRRIIAFGIAAIALTSLLIGTLLIMNPSGHPETVVKPKPTPTATFTPTPSPTPTPIPMVRMTIKLIDVFCQTNESGLFPDKFYVMTTFSAPDEDLHANVHTKSQLSVPFDIHGGQDLPMPSSPYTVFDALVPQHAQIKGGFTAYDDQQGLDWGNIQVWVGEIAAEVGNELLDQGIESGTWQAVVAGAVIELAVTAWYQIAGIDSNNPHQLGKEPLTFSSDGPSSEELVWHFQNSGGFLGAGSWDYTLRYEVTRSIVSS